MIIIFFSIIILCYSSNTYQRNQVWKDRFNLWMDTAGKSTYNARPHYNLGNAYKNIDRLDEAIAEYKRALAITPNYPDALYNLGNTYFKKGELDKAIHVYKKALAIYPNFSMAHYNLGSAYLKKGENKLAKIHFNMVKEINAKSTAPADINLSGIIKPNAGKTVAELYAQKDDLSGKEVMVRGRVVKFSKNIMGKNWIHLRDGTGGKGTNDLTITTSAIATLGDIVVVSGVVVANKDFGYGYKYDIIIEDAIVTVE